MLFFSYPLKTESSSRKSRKSKKQQRQQNKRNTLKQKKVKYVLSKQISKKKKFKQTPYKNISVQHKQKLFAEKNYQQYQSSTSKIQMGTTQPAITVTKRRSTLQQARIQGLYEMYGESIRVSSLIREQSTYEDGEYQYRNGKYVKKKKMLENEGLFLKELMDPFEQRHEYSWGNEISKLFVKHFAKGFEGKWYESKQFFYELLLENSGIQPESQELVAKSHLVTRQKQKKIKQLKSTTKQQDEGSFESYFLKIINQRNKSSSPKIQCSFAMIEQEQDADSIDRRKDEEIGQMAEVESMRMTGDESVNYINSSIIDAEEEKIFADKQLAQKDNDDEYFLPLITKRNKLKKNARKPSQDSNHISEPLIEMSQFESKAKYSRHRLESSSVILPSTVFYERMNFTAKVQTDQLLKIYRQLSNTIQQTINSCNLISCPLKHFMLYFEFKTSKKNINQLSRSSSFTTLAKSMSNDENTSSCTQPTSSESPKIHKHTSSSTRSRKSSSSSRKLSNNQELYVLLTQTSQRSELVRRKREYNTNYLLKEIREFAQAYTEFLYKYLNFGKIEQTDLQNFINLDTVYGIVLRNIWNIVTWIADRGYEWEEYVVKQIVIKESSGNFTYFTQQQAIANPHLILQSYAKFANKDIKKIRIQPGKFLKAYLALLKLKDQIFPQKYLKKIIIFYRQATKCCQGADDLMTLYEFLLKNCILNGLTQEMHIFRMKNIIDKLIPIESSSIDGAGEIVYAWTTWNIILEMFMLKLNEYKQMELQQKDEQRRHKNNSHQSEKKGSVQSQKNGSVYSRDRPQENNPLSDIKQTRQTGKQKTGVQNPQKRPTRKLQY